MVAVADSFAAAGVKLQPPAGDGVVTLQHQGVLNIWVIDKLLHLREKCFDVLIYTQPNAGEVYADIDTPMRKQDESVCSDTMVRIFTSVNVDVSGLRYS
jgi:hypothetical protein